MGAKIEDFYPNSPLTDGFLAVIEESGEVEHASDDLGALLVGQSRHFSGALETCILQYFVHVAFATLRRFWSVKARDLYFTIENEGRFSEGFKSVRHSAAVCALGLSRRVFYNTKSRSTFGGA